jgi:hypothetical protein
MPSNYQERKNRDGNRQSRGEKCAFWKAHWRKKSKRASLGQNWAKPTLAQQSRPRGEAVERTGPEGRRPWRALRARPHPPHYSSAPPHAHRLQLMQWRRCGGGFSEPGHQGASTSSYIKKGTPHTHNTQHTQHTTLHSLTPHSLSLKELPLSHYLTLT